MIPFDLSDVTENGASIDELLTQLYPYITTLVRERVRSTKIADSDLEIDDLIQSTIIKLWSVLNHRRIENPKAYIGRIIRSVIIDTVRQHKRALLLPVDEDGELYTGTVIVTPQEGMVDPSVEFELEETRATLVADIASAVSSLPPRQQRAMISLLAEQVGDMPQLVEAFKKYQVDVVVDWPEDKSERLLLKASLAAARKKVGCYMDIKQSEHDEVDKAPIVQRREAIPAYEDELSALDQRDEVLQEVGMEAYVDKLREPYRTAVELHYVKKHTYPQIADELKLPVGTVKSHISRGMKMLRKLKDVGSDLYEESERGPDIAEIVSRVETLSEPYRTPVELHYVKKHTCQQIAGELNLPKGTVKSHISRGMKMLWRLA